MPGKDTAVNDEIRKALQRVRPRRKTADVAQSIGLTYHRLSNLANGKVVPNPAELDALRAELGLPDHWPYGPSPIESARRGQVVSLSGTPLLTIPVVGNASAGPGVWNVDAEASQVRVPSHLSSAGTIGFVVEGDSMMPLLEEFDTAVFKRAATARNGHVFLLRSTDGYLVKLLSFDRGDWYLVSLNRNYPPVPVPPGTEILGALVGYYRVRGTRELMEIDADGLQPSPSY